MEFYINGASAISHQATFNNKGYTENVPKLNSNHELIAPNYKEYIDSKALRRMSKILRMSITCGIDCLSQSGIKNTDSIIIGTGLGCLMDTEKFLKNFLTLEGLIPPTAFIQSTHNTIAGQLSLLLENNNYNMTHTQNTVSFEHALLDSMLRLNENDNNVLVGAVDEHIPLLDSIASDIGVEIVEGKMTSGAAMFTLSNEKNKHSLARVIDVETYYGKSKNLQDQVNKFIDGPEIDLVLTNSEEGLGFDIEKVVNYSSIFGYSHSGSALALHYAVDIINEVGKQNVLVVNHLNDNMGLILISTIEA